MTEHPRTGPTSPIIDCEPPPSSSPPGPPPSLSALRRRGTHHRVSLPASPPAVPPMSMPPAAAVAFAESALRRILEVVDRRRPVTQLRGLIAPGLIDATSALARAPQPGGTAVLRRVRLRAVTPTAHPGDTGPICAAEVFGSYTRGARVRAFAARIELVTGRWQVVALHLG